jgi:hypothetical protein
LVSVFYGDAADWKAMIAGQALLPSRQAVIGLSGSSILTLEVET